MIERATAALPQDADIDDRKDEARLGSGSAPPKLLTPILVFCGGRSGSTALMSLLGGSPRVTFDKRYPYESSYLSYLAHVASVIGGPCPKPDESLGRDRTALVTGASKMVGAMPFTTRGYIPRRGLAHEALIGLWAAFSRTIAKKARRQGQEPPTHYAEKSGLFVKDIVPDKLDAHQLYLMRDPRDIMMSSKNFNAKRQTLRFGWRADDTDASYAKRFVKRTRKRLEAALGVEPGDDRKMVVRYEDLVLNPEATAARLSEFLGIELRTVDQLAANEAHKTSSDPGASVGRWRREMDEEVQAIFDEQLGDVLDRAGYERAEATRGLTRS